MFGTLPGLAAATQRTVTTLAERLLALFGLVNVHELQAQSLVLLKSEAWNHM